MKNEQLKRWMRMAAIAGNSLFVLWMAFNAMDDGFRGTLPEKLSAIGLTGLLALNSILVLSGKTTAKSM